MKIKFSLLIVVVSVCSIFAGYKIGSAEMFGAGGTVLFPGTGYSVLQIPSLAIFNKHNVLDVSTKYLYSTLDVESKNYSAGIEYKYHNYFLLGAGNYLQIMHFNTLYVAGGIGYQYQQDIAFGGSMHIEQTKSSYDTSMTYHLAFSGTYKWSFILLSAGGIISDFSKQKEMKFYLTSSFILKKMKIGLENAFEYNQYIPTIGMDFQVNRSLQFRLGMNTQEYTAGLGVNIYKSIFVNYAFNWHRELGYSHFVDLKLLYK